MGSLQRMMVKEFPYWDINQSKWFKDLSEGCQNSERHNNRIFIYFDNKEKAESCIEKCETRNISHVGYLEYLENTSHKIYRVDILMNWKERRPSRLRSRKEQILD